MRRDATIEIGEITIHADRTTEIDEVALFRAALEKAARKREILWSGDPNQDHYILSLAIVDYEPGNAFKRWLVPGYGSTILRIEGELVDPRDDSVAGKVHHEVSVSAGGAYTIGAWQSIFGSMAEDVMRDLEQRAERKGFTVALVPWSTQDVEIPRAVTPRTIQVAQLREEREEWGRIGEREAAFGVSMGDVYASRSVPSYLREAIADDLRRQGHRVVEEQPADLLTGAVTRFWLHTDTTPLYWDIIAQIEMRVAIASETASLVMKETTISCESEDRTYVYPSASLMRDVLMECVGDLMESLREAMSKPS